jgi:hypothetical protein
MAKQSFTMDSETNNPTNQSTQQTPAQQPLLMAVEAHFIAQRARAAANINGYLNSSVGVAEHPDIVGEAIKLLKDIDEADGMIDTLRRITQPQ